MLLWSVPAGPGMLKISLPAAFTGTKTIFKVDTSLGITIERYARTEGHLVKLERLIISCIGILKALMYCGFGSTVVM